MPAIPRPVRVRLGDGLTIFAVALLLRLLFAVLTADTYDPDEFVYLTLSRQMAHGAVPYHTFMFFHPPGLLVLLRALQPLVGLWWPVARVIMIVLDSASAVLVWKIGKRVYGEREAFIAGLIFAASPVALLASVRVGQDPLITALGLAGLLALLRFEGLRGALLAGSLLGVGVWIKYPALFFLPVYVAAAPRRAAVTVAACFGATGALLLPFAGDVRELWTQTVTWQMHRAPMDGAHRLAATLSFWLLLTPLALPSAFRNRFPSWLLLGFGLGGLFGLAAEVYYHYFDPVVPFAALVSAPLLLQLASRRPLRTWLATATFVGLWGTALTVAPVQAGLGALRLSATAATVRLVDRLADSDDHILADQFEYTYLAHRAPAVDYFWDMRSVTSDRSLERLLPAARIVISTPASWPSYPPGFIASLRSRGYSKMRVGPATLWIPPPVEAEPHLEGKSARPNAVLT